MIQKSERLVGSERQKEHKAYICNGVVKPGYREYSGGRGGGRVGRGRGRGRGGAQNKFKGKCHKCDQWGHMAKDCIAILAQRRVAVVAQAAARKQGLWHWRWIEMAEE